MKQVENTTISKTAPLHGVTLPPSRAPSRRQKSTKTSPYLKRNKELLTYLFEEEKLTEKEIHSLLWYRKMHFKSKRDMGAPRQSISHLEYFNKHFSAPQHTPEEVNEQEAQKLQDFRQKRRQLFEQHQGALTFVETLFDYPRNDLDCFKAISPEEQQGCIKKLKLFAVQIIKLS